MIMYSYHAPMLVSQAVYMLPNTYIYYIYQGYAIVWFTDQQKG